MPLHIYETHSWLHDEQGHRVEEIVVFLEEMKLGKLNGSAPIECYQLTI